MSTIPQVAATLQSVFDSEIEGIGHRTGLIQRIRKFTAVLLLKMVVFTLLKSPRAKTKDYVSTAAQLGLTITERAVESGLRLNSSGSSARCSRACFRQRWPPCLSIPHC